jgi:hypothetical protein
VYVQLAFVNIHALVGKFFEAIQALALVGAILVYAFRVLRTVGQKRDVRLLVITLVYIEANKPVAIVAILALARVAAHRVDALCVRFVASLPLVNLISEFVFV